MRKCTVQRKEREAPIMCLLKVCQNYVLFALRSVIELGKPWEEPQVFLMKCELAGNSSKSVPNSFANLQHLIYTLDCSTTELSHPLTILKSFVESAPVFMWTVSQNGPISFWMLLLQLKEPWECSLNLYELIHFHLRNPVKKNYSKSLHLSIVLQDGSQRVLQFNAAMTAEIHLSLEYRVLGLQSLEEKKGNYRRVLWWKGSLVLSEGFFFFWFLYTEVPTSTV